MNEIYVLVKADSEMEEIDAVAAYCTLSGLLQRIQDFADDYDAVIDWMAFDAGFVTLYPDGFVDEGFPLIWKKVSLLA